MSKGQNAYFGRSGQLVVMAEFLARSYNVAMPEVDVGDDIFVVAHGSDNLWRIQVKTAFAKGSGKKSSAQFNIPLSQLRKADEAELNYVCVVRHEERWKDFVIRKRSDLLTDVDNGLLGRRAEKNLILHLDFSDMALTCGGRNWQQYWNNWSEWPALDR